MKITVKRFQTNKIDGRNVKVTPQGFLLIPAFTARTGIQTYQTIDGKKIKEFRPSDEVFSESSMSSLRTAVVTDGHPPEMVDPDNVDKYMVGHTNGTVTREKTDSSDEEFLATHLIITHRDAIEAINAGKAELSNGYRVDLEFSPGEHRGEKFDAIQRNIVNNHIAIVWKGRAGRLASLKLDEQDAILITDNQKKGEVMKVTVNGKEYDVSDDLVKDLKADQEKGTAELATEKKRADAAETKAGKNDSEKVKELEKENKTLKEEKVKTDAKVDSLSSDLEKSKDKKTDSVSVSEAVQVRMAVMSAGRNMLDAETVSKLDSMSDREIKVAVIKVDSPNADEEKLKNDSYVDARFDHIKENLVVVDGQKRTIGNDISKNREDKKEEDTYKTPSEKRADSIKESQKDWQKPIGRRIES